MTQRSKFLLAALTSAAKPELVVAGVSDSAQTNSEDQRLGIDQAVVQDSAGTRYDVLATDTEMGRQRLGARVAAAQCLDNAKEINALSFSVDKVIAYADGSDPTGPTGNHAVVIARHRPGRSRPLDLLTLDDCEAVGTAIGAVHRLPASVLQNSRYPVISTEHIHSQLVAWIDRLRHAGHVPHEITDSWSRIIATDGLWSFTTCFVHGGFHNGDILFNGSTITTITNWQDMQINDPARDLAWIFSKLDDGHRNALMSSYGRMRGAKLDGLIMLRANLWLQMEQVGGFIEALNHADNAKIMEFKARVERLAHQLGTMSPHRAATQAPRHASPKPPVVGASSTITVGSLLSDDHDDRTASRDIESTLMPQNNEPTEVISLFERAHHATNDHSERTDIGERPRQAGDSDQNFQAHHTEQENEQEKRNDPAERPSPVNRSNHADQSSAADQTNQSKRSLWTSSDAMNVSTSFSPDDTSRTVVVESPVMATGDGIQRTDPTSATILIPEVDSRLNAERDAREGLTTAPRDAGPSGDEARSSDGPASSENTAPAEDVEPEDDDTNDTLRREAPPQS
ncbi:phosphotransferase [uncultured Bifidobacterium sp.]|uniref:phosphotransferase n=1 Tax=uncultured Bifidobacterium sp. TaxID=165187 RepID=UPI0026264F5B|nr:phosphotransferase [uncultured Bifidobacterium sp.]